MVSITPYAGMIQIRSRVEGLSFLSAAVGSPVFVVLAELRIAHFHRLVKPGALSAQQQRFPFYNLGKPPKRCTQGSK